MGKGDGTPPHRLNVTRNLSRWVAIGASLFCGALILYATRRDPVLSPDSISYLSTATHLRSGNGFTEFTGQPLTVFGPLLPIVLAVGGRSLLWARLVCIAGVAGATWLMFVLLARRVRPWTAVAAAGLFGLSQGLVRVGSTVWSETPYILITLAALAVLTKGPLNERRAALGGFLCGLGFLTRYAGIGLLITGSVVVALASLSLERRQALRLLSIHVGAGAVTCALWLVRNLIATGEPLGPRFSGGAPEGLQVLMREAANAIGELVLGNRATAPQRLHSGVVILILLLLAVAAGVTTIALGSRELLDVAMVVFAITSVFIPVIARKMTASDIDFRVMSPLLVPIVYTLAVCLDAIRIKPLALLAGVALGSWWGYQGVAMADRVPEIVAYGAGSRTQFSEELFDLIDTLPATANVMTNNPQRVWWQNDRNPTLFGFVRPRAGNSNYPLSPADTLKYACMPDTFLAWFAGGDRPTVRRPDLAAIIDVTLVQTVSRGELYRLTPHDRAQCPK